MRRLILNTLHWNLSLYCCKPTEKWDLMDIICTWSSRGYGQPSSAPDGSALSEAKSCSRTWSLPAEAPSWTCRSSVLIPALQQAQSNHSAERWIACSISTAFLLHIHSSCPTLLQHTPQMCSDIFESGTDLLGLCKKNIKHSLLLFRLGPVFSLCALMLKIQRSKTFKCCQFG